MIHFSMRLIISSASGFFVSLDFASSLVPMFCCLLVVDFEFGFFFGTRFSMLNINRFKTGSRPGRMGTKLGLVTKILNIFFFSSSGTSLKGSHPF